MNVATAEYDRLLDQLARLREAQLASIAGIDALAQQIDFMRKQAADDDGLPRLLSINDVAGVLDIHPKTVYAWVHDGRLPSVRLSEREIRVAERDLREWIASRPPASEYTPISLPQRRYGRR